MAISPRRLLAVVSSTILTTALALVVTATPAAAACAAGQAVATSGVIGAFSGQSAHGGTRFAWLDGYGSAHTDTLTQSVTLTAGCSTATLSFWLHIDTAETGGTADDRLTVQFGSTTLNTYSNLNAAAGYQLRTVDLSAFAGQTQTLRFAGVEDASAQTSFVIDDVAINVSGDRRR